MKKRPHIELIEGQWRVKGEGAVYRGPVQWGGYAVTFGRVVSWIITSALVYGISACTRILIGG